MAYRSEENNGFSRGSISSEMQTMNFKMVQGAEEPVETGSHDYGENFGEVHDMLLKFLLDVGWSNTRESNSLDQLDDVFNLYIKAAPDSTTRSMYLKGLCMFAHLCYKGRTLEDQMKIAHGTAIMTAIDDLGSKHSTEGEVFREDMTLFSLKLSNPKAYEKLYPNRGPLHPMLEEMITHLSTELNPFFPNQPRFQGIYLSGVLQFIDVTQTEHFGEIHTSTAQLTSAMQHFPDFIRGKSGIAETFATFIFSSPRLVPGKYSPETLIADTEFYYCKIFPILPAILDAINLINDILSFYKETKDGETRNFIYSLAQVKQISPLGALRMSIDRALQSVICSREIAQASGSFEVRNALEDFCQGYIAWHFSWEARYRLSELFGNDWYQGERLHA